MTKIAQYLTLFLGLSPGDISTWETLGRVNIGRDPEGGACQVCLHLR